MADLPAPDSLSSTAQPPEPPARPSPRLSSGWTILSGLFLAGYLLIANALHIFSHPLSDVPSPEQALALVVSRSMDVEGALARAPAWEQRLYDVLSGTTRADELTQNIRWYEELAAFSDDPAPQVHLAFLELEADRRGQALRRVRSWTDDGGPLPAYARLVEAAAGVGDPLTGEEWAAVTPLAPTLTSGWFADRLMIALAERAGETTQAQQFRARLRARADRLLWWSRAVSGLDLALGFAGFIAVLWLGARRRRPALSIAPFPPPWPGSAGATVLIRGAAAGFLLATCVVVIGSAARLGRTWEELAAYPLFVGPLVLLTRRDLLGPVRLGFRQGFGLTIASERRVELVLATLAGLWAMNLGDWLLNLTAERLRLLVHWTEWFDPALASGTLLEAAGSLVNGVVLAPPAEELLYRGVLYGTLRRKFGWAASAAISAAIFAGSHGYGLLGWCSTFWSGLVWARLYERTRSLWPGILTHAAVNLSASAGVLLLRVP